MDREKALDFAKVCIRLYGHEGSFGLEFEWRDEYRAALSAFRSLGYEVVEGDRARLELTVQVP